MPAATLFQNGNRCETTSYPLLTTFCSLRLLLTTSYYLLGVTETSYQVLRRLTAHYSLPTRCETASYVSLYDPTASASCEEFSPAAPHLAHQSLHHEVQRLTLQQARPHPNPNPCPSPNPNPNGSRCSRHVLTLTLIPVLPLPLTLTAQAAAGTPPTTSPTPCRAPYTEH